MQVHALTLSKRVEELREEIENEMGLSQAGGAVRSSKDIGSR